LNTTALGGVATGSINAKLAARLQGTASKSIGRINTIFPNILFYQSLLSPSLSTNWCSNLSQFTHMGQSPCPNNLRRIKQKSTAEESQNKRTLHRTFVKGREIEGCTGIKACTS